MKNKDNSAGVEFSRFIIVGGLATLIHVIAAVTTVKLFDFDILHSNLAGFSSAVLVSYVCNSLWSFSRSLGMPAFLRFTVVSSFMFGVVILLSKVATFAGLSSLQGIALVVLVNPVFSFLFHKFWTFSRTSS